MMRCHRLHERLALSWLTGWIGVAACGGQGANPSPTGTALETTKVQGAIVAHVDGQPITAAEVGELPDLPPHEALRRLEAERLLMAEAARRGYGSSGSVARVERQALVQAVLDDEAASVEVTTKELRAAYDEQRERFRRPERRASLHILARVPEDAGPELDADAQRFAARVVGELEAAKSVDEVFARYRGVHEGKLDVVAERIPAAGRDAPFVKAYLDAVFSLDGTGVVPKPVRTRFGWHAIVVTAINPETYVAFEKAAEELRPELLTEKRAAHVKQFTGELRREMGAQLVPEAMARLRAME